MKEPAVFQKELRLNLAGPEPSRGGERTNVTFRGKTAREQTQQAGLSTMGEREREGERGRGGSWTERNRGREREREGGKEKSERGRKKKRHQTCD